MRTMHLAAAISAALLLPAIAIAQPPHVSFSGCPMAGTHPGCVLVRSGRRTFDVSSAAPPIRSIRVGVRGSGVPGGRGVCMQGIALRHVRYTATRLRCGHPRLR